MIIPVEDLRRWDTLAWLHILSKISGIEIMKNIGTKWIIRNIGTNENIYTS